MTKLLKALFGSSTPKKDEFTEFFQKSSGDRVKVIREVLREANAEQRRVVGSR